MTTGISVQLRNLRRWNGSTIDISWLSLSNHSYLRCLLVSIWRHIVSLRVTLSVQVN